LKLLRERERGVREGIERLDRDVALHAVGGLIDDLNEHYADVPAVVGYLGQLQDDMVAHVDLFRAPAAEPTPAAAGPTVPREQALRRYRVNVVVSQVPDGAPVVVEANPTYQNLVGRVEKEVQFGALTTDFTLIRAGALHRANGGYLVLRAEDVLRQPLAWDGLKRALRHREITIEDPSDVLGMAAVRTLRPEPIPLDVKVVLVGEPQTYFLLHGLDPDFPELFRVRADFDGRMPRTPENEDAFVAFVGRVCQEESLRHFDREALALLIEHSSRLAEDQQQLSVQFGTIADVVREANYWAGAKEAATVGAVHVRDAIEQKSYRSGLIEERLREAIDRQILVVDVSGVAVGQINGLAVQAIADYSFGHPSRITASVGIGRDGLVDIEREVNLGGRLHSKGVLILAGFLTERFATNRPLALSARLAFEQSYAEIDGDSASSAELYALLSALADTPIKQTFAVTGSVNQKGQVQAIGGVNEKIEGFFAVCRARGLTGEHGVLIPAANVAHLMLRDAVLAAVRAGQFHVYAVSTVDEGIALLTGLPAGERNETGHFPADTINGRIEARLDVMARALRLAAGRRADEE
jgi:lon-related putative ATP-dependent protease